MLFPKFTATIYSTMARTAQRNQVSFITVIFDIVDMVYAKFLTIFGWCLAAKLTDLIARSNVYLKRQCEFRGIWDERGSIFPVGIVGARAVVGFDYTSYAAITVKHPHVWGNIARESLSAIGTYKRLARYSFFICVLFQSADNGLSLFGWHLVPSFFCTLRQDRSFDSFEHSSIAITGTKAAITTRQVIEYISAEITDIFYQATTPICIMLRKFFDIFLVTVATTESLI